MGTKGSAAGPGAAPAPSAPTDNDGTKISVWTEMKAGEAQGSPSPVSPVSRFPGRPVGAPARPERAVPARAAPHRARRSRSRALSLSRTFSFDLIIFPISSVS